MKNLGETALGAWIAFLLATTLITVTSRYIEWPNWTADFWATWATALATFGAAVVALWIAGQASRQQRQEATAAMGAFIDASMNLFMDVYRDCKSGQVGMIDRRLRELQVLSVFGQRLEIGRLDQYDAWLALHIQQLTVHLQALLEKPEVDLDTNCTTRAKIVETYLGHLVRVTNTRNARRGGLREPPAFVVERAPDIQF